MFEPVHGSAPPLVGKERANPMGAILRWRCCSAIGAPEAANVDDAFAPRSPRTSHADWASDGTRAVGDWIANRVGG